MAEVTTPTSRGKPSQSDGLRILLFGMPAARGDGVSISRDGKSIVAVDKENPGWTWTYTPTGLR